MRRRPGTFSFSSRSSGGRWLRRLALAALFLAVLLLLYSCAVRQLVYSARGTVIFLPELPRLR